MTSGAAFLRFLLSSGGVLVSLLALGIWVLLRPASRAARRTFLGVGLGYAMVSSYPIPHRVELWLARDFHPLAKAEIGPQRTVVVLLGSGSYTQRDWSGTAFSVLDHVGAERTLEAARVFRLIDPAWIISSGGQAIADDPDDTAGEVMKNTLIQLGVPADRILVERESRTTRDEAMVVRSMLPPLDVQQIVLVTSDVHMRRSIGVFRSVGLDPIPAIARTSPHVGDSGILSYLPSGSGFDASEGVAHEILGLGYYWLRGWHK